MWLHFLSQQVYSWWTQFFCYQNTFYQPYTVSQLWPFLSKKAFATLGMHY